MTPDTDNLKIFYQGLSYVGSPDYDEDLNCMLLLHPQYSVDGLEYSIDGNPVHGQLDNGQKIAITFKDSLVQLWWSKISYCFDVSALVFKCKVTRDEDEIDYEECVTECGCQIDPLSAEPDTDNCFYLYPENPCLDEIFGQGCDNFTAVKITPKWGHLESLDNHIFELGVEYDFNLDDETDEEIDFDDSDDELDSSISESDYEEEDEEEEKYDDF